MGDLTGFEHDTDSIAFGSFKCDYEDRVELTQIVSGDESAMALALVNVDTSQQEALTKHLSVEGKSTLPAVSHNWIDDKTVIVLIFINRKAATELVWMEI